MPGNDSYYQADCSDDSLDELGSPSPSSSSSAGVAGVVSGSADRRSFHPTGANLESGSSSSSSDSDLELAAPRCSPYCVRGLLFLSAAATVGMALLYTFREKPIPATGLWLFATGLSVATFASVEEVEQVENNETGLLGGSKSISNYRKMTTYSAAILSVGSAVAACCFSVKHEPSVASVLWGVVIAAAVLAQRTFDYESPSASTVAPGYGTIN